MSQAQRNPAGQGEPDQVSRARPWSYPGWWVHVFNCRSEKMSKFKKCLFANPVLCPGVLAWLAVHVAAVHLPWLQDLLGFTALDAQASQVATPSAGPTGNHDAIASAR